MEDIDLYNIDLSSLIDLQIPEPVDKSDDDSDFVPEPKIKMPHKECLRAKYEDAYRYWTRQDDLAVLLVISRELVKNMERGKGMEKNLQSQRRFNGVVDSSLQKL